MRRVRAITSPYQIFLAICISLFALITAQAQVATLDNTTVTPTPGVGHDYIQMLSEIVNPANGSVSLRIQLPVASGRGITLPFSIGYDSNSVHHLLPGNYPNYGTAYWASNTSYLAQGGWSYSVPTVSFAQWPVPAGNYPNNRCFRQPLAAEPACGFGG